MVGKWRTFKLHVLYDHLKISKVPGIKRFTICNLSVRQQSIHAGFRPLHSAEMTLLQVCRGLLLDEDWSGCSVLLLLDIITVLDTVDRTIIINRLERRAGVTDTAPQWFRAHFFNISLCHWSPANVPHGVPQGSVLSPHSFLH